MRNSTKDTVKPSFPIVGFGASAGELPGRLLTCLKMMRKPVQSNIIDSKYLSNLEKIILLLREQTGHDFSQYKKNTLFRRIEWRKGIHQIDKISTYVEFLQQNPNETELLFKEMLIGVTSFFRDSFLWDKLRDDVVPELIKVHPGNHQLRAWVIGCSTGEEAYSLAIIFKEAIKKAKKKVSVSLQIFATDIDTDAVDKARIGLFPKNIEANVSSERLNAFFTVEANGYRIIPAIRKMIVFAPQDAIKDPPFTRIDLLTCRNLLIYMEPELQHKLMGLFTYSLNPGGFLALGSAETPGTLNETLKEIDARLRIYQRTDIY